MTTYRPDPQIGTDVHAYLDRHAERSMLRFITCGSVDDGKSTLIGRLLYDTKAVYADQLAALEEDSRRFGTQGREIDFALLVDGLAAEREQGITIDVAYRFFSTERRKFIVADTPGHEQYTRNMVTGASTADLAVVLVDARSGVVTQTRRHSFLARLIGIRHIVLAVNKMDLIGYDEERFARVADEYRTFARSIGLADVVAIPLSGLTGANVAIPSPATPWYRGPTLIRHLEDVRTDEQSTAAAFRMPVQWVNRPSPDFRGFSGLIASGTVEVGTTVRVVPSGRTSSVARIVAPDGERRTARAGESVTLVLADDVDCSRGDVIAAGDPPEAASQLLATMVWADGSPLIPGRPYWLKLGAQTVGATVDPPRHVVDVNTQAHVPAATLALNDIGLVEVRTDRPVVFAPYAEGRDLGGFILIDRESNSTVAAGLIEEAIDPRRHLHRHMGDVGREARAARKGQVPRVLWFTGLSGSGKSTIASLVERKLHALGRHTFLLDGDNVRHGLNRDLGFGDADRIENIRRVGEVARLMADAGLIVLAAFISPFRADRAMVRALMPPGEFVEIFIDTPIADAEARDVKGLYAKARTGEIARFTGVSSPYEAPEAPELRIDTRRESAERAAERIVDHILGIWSPDL